jgi:hydroxymethylpyrimidine pyrophosphatase-like HAD family hydrolase
MCGYLSGLTILFLNTELIMLLPLFIVDIDSNLGQSKANCPPDGELTVMSVGLDGQPNTFMTASQLAFFNWLRASGRVVPNTARHSSGIERMRIPFTDYAITSFGGAILLPDRSPEPTWQSHVHASAATTEDILTEIKATIDSEASAAGIIVRSAIKSEFGSAIFLELKHRGPELSERDDLDQLIEKLAPSGWQRHRNDETFALLPPWLGKEKAAKYFVEEIAEPALFVIGMGDSLTDLPFMQTSCGYAMVPTNSQAFTAIMDEVKI